MVGSECYKACKGLFWPPERLLRLRRPSLSQPAEGAIDNRPYTASSLIKQEDARFWQTPSSGQHSLKECHTDGEDLTFNRQTRQARRIFHESVERRFKIAKLKATALRFTL